MSDKVQFYCQYCGSGCVRCGKHSNGSQKLHCKICFKYQLQIYANRGCMKNTKDNISKIYLKNVGIRGVSELLGIAPGTVLKAIKKFKHYRPLITFHSHQEYEIDELQTYVKNKKYKRWVAYAMEKCTRSVVQVAVGRRTNETLKKVVDSVLSLCPKKICTDGLKNYKSLIPSNLHRIQKTQLQLIERNNLTSRGKLRRLNRKTIAFSKSQTMLEASVKLLFWKEPASFLLL